MNQFLKLFFILFCSAYFCQQKGSVTIKDFTISELHRNRKIWIYLPPDYDQSQKKYPVIYMHDGQNLFDPKTSFAGEWEVDETLDRIFENTKQSAIVVGIDNGSEKRLNEYSPWKNEKYKAGGEGDLYVNFLVNSLKPYIDKTYRTKTKPQETIIAGSSMGGLISLYAAVKYPHIFGKAGIFSPAFWFASSDLKKYISENQNKIQKSKFYIVAGKNEDESMVPEIESVEKILKSKSVSDKNMLVKIDADGTHSENYWRRELEASLLWLLK